MSLTITNTSGVIVREAERIESGFERVQSLEASVPDLIKKNGELLAALVVTQGECGNLESAHNARKEGLRAQISTLRTAIAVQREKVSRLEPQVNQLQQSVDDMNSPAGQAAVYEERIKRLGARGF